MVGLSSSIAQCGYVAKGFHWKLLKVVSQLGTGIDE
jgi:hypothetical protein